MTKITGLQTVDVRYPTSRWLIGSDAVHPDPDYSAAYVILRTDSGLDGHGFTFTIGRGTEVVVAGIEALRHLVVGRDLQAITAAMGEFWNELTNDGQLRWLGPEKGVMHLATAALLNAIWDLWAKQEGKPLWKLLADMPPAQLVACLDFRYVTDAMTPDEAIEMLTAEQSRRGDRERELESVGIPAYTTSAGWLGYPDEKIRALCRDSMEQGWTRFKMKVGASLDDDVRRAGLIRDEIGPENLLMMDANQRWDVDAAIEWMQPLRDFDPLWIEEPTSPDDILGHARIAKGVAPVGVATGEHVHNRVMFKQYMEAGAMAFCQLDACRLGGFNEAILVTLLAKRFSIPVCPHAGGVGLCEYHQHLAAFDHVCLGGDLDMRLIEFADHLHEHFVDPAVIERGRYTLPRAPGTSGEMKQSSLETYAFPWRGGEVPPVPEFRE
jgi:L-fuconate dehydratase